MRQRNRGCRASIPRLPSRARTMLDASIPLGCPSLIFWKVVAVLRGDLSAPLRALPPAASRGLARACEYIEYTYGALSCASHETPTPHPWLEAATFFAKVSRSSNAFC